jgi:type II secretory pathway component PulC
MKQAAFQVRGLVATSFLLACVGLLLGLAQPPGVRAQATAGKEAKKETKAAAGREVKLRDPFRSLVRKDEQPDQVLPPGKRGLVIGRLTVNGIVAGAERIAVVTMRGRNRAYFLRERDELYDGYVARITEDHVVFKERASDAFGSPYEREVTKQISGSGAKR